MLRFLSKKNKRKLAMVNELSYSKSMIESAFFENSFSCDKRSVFLLIQEINREYEQLLTIDSYDNYISITYKNNANINVFIKYLLQKQTIVQILNSIFFNPNININELSDVIYSSNSTIYRNVQKFNKIKLADFSIVQENNQLYFNGDEVNIRYFFYRFFYEIYNPFDGGFSNLVDEDMFGKFIEEILEFFEIKCDGNLFNTIYLTSIVSYIRYAQGYRLKKNINACFLDKIHKIEASDCEKKALYEEALKIDVNEDFLSDILNDYIKSKNYLSFDQADDLQKDDRIIDLLSVFHSISEDFNIDKVISSNLCIDIDVHCYLESSSMGSKYLIFDENQLLADRFKSKNPGLYSRICEDLSDFYKRHYHIKAPKSLINKLLVIVINNWNLLNEEFTKDDLLRVLILSNKSEHYAQDLKNRLNTLFGKALYFETAKKNYLINYEEIQQCDFEIIISDFYIPHIGGKDLLIVENPLSDDDYEKLFKTIYRRLRKNRLL